MCKRAAVHFGPVFTIAEHPANLALVEARLLCSAQGPQISSIRRPVMTLPGFSAIEPLRGQGPGGERGRFGRTLLIATSPQCLIR